MQLLKEQTKERLEEPALVRVLVVVAFRPRSQLDYLDRQTSSFSSAAEDPPRSPRGQKSAFSDLSYHLPERFLDKNDLEQSSAFGYR